MANKRPWEALDLHLVKWGCGRILTILLILISVAGASTRSPREVEIEKLLKKLNKLPIKTIKSPEGEIIDCVDIYKQPAFDHPLLKNHTIELRPSFNPEMVDTSNYSSEYVEPIWRQNRSCPEGTIPIRRVRKSDLLRVESLESFGMVHPNPFRPTVGRQELAGARMINPYQLYNGVGGDLSVWRPFVERVEATTSSIKIGYQGDVINAGWMVTHYVAGDAEPRSFVAWKSRRGGGCFNLLCPGFIQTNPAVVLGARLPISRHGGPLSVRRFQIYKTSNHKWWVRINGVEVGYYPPEIFHNEFNMADSVEWGGSVVNTMNLGHHAITQMGSGRFAEEGYGRAAHFENMMYFDHYSRYMPAHNLQVVVSFPRCYNAILRQRPSDSFLVLYYGGPGGIHCDRALSG